MILPVFGSSAAVLLKDFWPVVSHECCAIWNSFVLLLWRAQDTYISFHDATPIFWVALATEELRRSHVGGCCSVHIQPDGISPYSLRKSGCMWGLKLTTQTCPSPSTLELALSVSWLLHVLDSSHVFLQALFCSYANSALMENLLQMGTDSSLTWQRGDDLAAPGIEASHARCSTFPQWGGNNSPVLEAKNPFTKGEGRCQGGSANSSDGT